MKYTGRNRKYIWFLIGGCTIIIAGIVWYVQRPIVAPTEQAITKINQELFFCGKNLRGMSVMVGSRELVGMIGSVGDKQQKNEGPGASICGSLSSVKNNFLEVGAKNNGMVITDSNKKSYAGYYITIQDKEYLVDLKNHVLYTLSGSPGSYTVLKLGTLE